jgi:hypothetical protein
MEEHPPTTITTFDTKEIALLFMHRSIHSVLIVNEFQLIHLNNKHMACLISAVGVLQNYNEIEAVEEIE